MKSDYTCVARPCLHYPHTQIPKGQEAWVNTPGGMQESRHQDCKNQPGSWEAVPSVEASSDK